MIARPSAFELGKDGPSSIAVGVDDSPLSTRARAYAVGVAHRPQARLIAVHARPACSSFDLVPEAAAIARQTRDELVDQLRRDVGDASTYGRSRSSSASETATRPDNFRPSQSNCAQMPSWLGRPHKQDIDSSAPSPAAL
jgi:universal stress protein family protein